MKSITKKQVLEAFIKWNTAILDDRESFQEELSPLSDVDKYSKEQADSLFEYAE